MNLNELRVAIMHLKEIQNRTDGTTYSMCKDDPAEQERLKIKEALQEMSVKDLSEMLKAARALRNEAEDAIRNIERVMLE